MKKIILFNLFFTLLAFNISFANNQKLVNHYSFKLGQFKITALSDGLVSVPLSAYKGDKNYQSIEKQILKQHHYKLNKTNSVLVSLNAYLIQGDGENILVDTGSGGSLQPQADNGFLIKSLKAIGVKPNQINIILLTHLHPDHIGGLIAKDGKKIFPNAKLYINEKGWQFWHNQKLKEALPKFEKAWFTTVYKQTTPYQSNIVLFREYKQQLLPGIYAIPLPGHTPGHTGYLIKAKNGKSLLIWGDIVHVGMFEFSHPKWSMIFDINRRQAAKEHVKIMNWAASKHMLIAGMHLQFPGIGYVKKAGQSFKFIPYQQQA